MNRLEINPNNEKYYSKEFMQGYKCGTRSQFDADVNVLEQIKEEIANLDDAEYEFEGYYKAVNDALQIIDKHIKGDTDADSD